MNAALPLCHRAKQSTQHTMRIWNVAQACCNVCNININLNLLSLISQVKKGKPMPGAALLLVLQLRCLVNRFPWSHCSVMSLYSFCIGKQYVVMTLQNLLQLLWSHFHHIAVGALPVRLSGCTRSQAISRYKINQWIQHIGNLHQGVRTHIRCKSKFISFI